MTSNKKLVLELQELFKKKEYSRVVFEITSQTNEQERSSFLHNLLGLSRVSNNKKNIDALNLAIKDFKISLKNKFVTNIENLKKNYDSELKISTIDNQLFHKINNFSPFGIGNPKPKFIINDVVIRYPRVVGEKHLSFYFEDFYSTRIKAISFGSLGTKLGNLIKIDTKGNLVKENINLSDENFIDIVDNNIVYLNENRLTIKGINVELPFSKFSKPKIFSHFSNHSNRTE